MEINKAFKIQTRGSTCIVVAELGSWPSKWIEELKILIHFNSFEQNMD